MTLYLMRTGGLFSTGAAEPLPVVIRIIGKGKDARVTLDGLDVPTMRDGSVPLQAVLKDGVHTLAVDGVSCEGITVRDGMVRPAGTDLRPLVPEIARLMGLEDRVRALEEKAKQNEVNWLL